MLLEKINHYLFLANMDDDEDYMIRKTVSGENDLVALDDEDEYKNALYLYTTKVAAEMI